MTDLTSPLARRCRACQEPLWHGYFTRCVRCRARLPGVRPVPLLLCALICAAAASVVTLLRGAR